MSALPILQCALAAGISWWVAHDLVGHERPFFAPIAAVISLGVSLGQRLRRVVELVVGVSVGILVGDLLISQIGSGAWQLVIVVALAMAVAVFADGGALFVAQAGSSAVLVATLLPPGETGGVDRWVDALIGGGIGLLVAAVLPSDPVGPVRREARAVLDELAAVLSGTAEALRDRDVEAAGRALRRARRSQPLIDSLRAALRSGREVTTVAPMHRPRRRTMGRYAELVDRADYAMRNARVLARRAYTALGDDEPAANALPDAISSLARAVGRLGDELGAEGDRTRAREPVLDAVHDSPVLSDATAARLGPSEQVMAAQARSIALDLLQATGMPRDEALQALRADPNPPDRVVES
ncbi:aromatic acid exporter family protein [Pseudonocardia bannensis]|uniref:Aromatic acid exporter family protein n=2 Tax=Pseudonocardia bannensis TaxID=630973 RepID=A0A848DIW2_9PSEU|nr:aromatic acid exporter family protein [Pseudonocardia bannensis]